MDGDLPLYTMPWKQQGDEVTEELRFSVNRFKGNEYFAVRVWFMGQGGKWFPGKNGINVPMEHAGEFVTMIDKSFTRLQALSKHGDVNLPRTEHQGSRKVKRGSRREKVAPIRPETPEEEQLQRESDERAGLNDRENFHSDSERTFTDPRD
jgi:hypothetical protein